MSSLRLHGALSQECEPFVLGEVCSAVARDFLQGSDGFYGISAVCDREALEGSEQAANESWGQLGYPVPDSRPLAADVSAAGHGYESYTGAAHLSR